MLEVMPLAAELMPAAGDKMPSIPNIECLHVLNDSHI